MERALVIYYSFSGNTKELAQEIAAALQTRFQTDLVRIEALDESASFFGQARRAFFKTEARIPDTLPFDVSAYALVAVGTPVWAFGAAPAVRSWLRRSRGFNAARGVAFATYGSGAGSKKCVDEMSCLLRAKGATTVKTLLIQQAQCSQPAMMRQHCAELMRDV